MASATSDPQTFTTLHIHRGTKDRLESLKPYESMSYNDLLADMADQYDAEERR